MSYKLRRQTKKILRVILFNDREGMGKEDQLNKNNSRKFWDGRGGITLRGLALALVALAFGGIASAQDNTVAKFKGGIGVIPVTGVAANGTVNLNIVRGVNPAGPWESCVSSCAARV